MPNNQFEILPVRMGGIRPLLTRDKIVCRYPQRGTLADRNVRNENIYEPRFKAKY